MCRYAGLMLLMCMSTLSMASVLQAAGRDYQVISAHIAMHSCPA